MNWEQDYRAFLDMFARVADSYKQYFPAKSGFTLDFEYKKLVPGTLSVKQVRELPLPGGSTQSSAVLLNEPSNFCVFQGEYGDVFANHRLKVRLFLATRSLILSSANGSNLYVDGRFEYLEGTQLKTLTGAPGTWPNASHSAGGQVSTNRWAVETGRARRDFELVAEIPPPFFPNSESRLLTLADFTLTLNVTYAQPVPTIDFLGNQTTTKNESVRLAPCPAPSEGDLLVERTFSAADGVSINTSFYWPPYPKGPTAGYTAPLVKWVETTITELTAQPITLRGDYSQTYRPGHHNFVEDFIFEPRLEPGLSQSVIDELTAKNILFVHVFYNGDQSRISVLGLDGKFRTLRK